MLRANLGLLVTVLAWGSMIPGINLMVPRWDPLFLTSSRYVVAAPIFLGIVWVLGERRGLWRALADRRVWVLGAVGIGVFGPLLVVGIANANPVTAAVLSAAGPPINAAVAWLWFGEKPPRGIAPAIALAVLGAVVATVDPTRAAGLFDLRGGEPLLLLASVFWAWYTLAAQRWLAGWPQLTVAATTIATGSVVSAAIFLLLAGLGLAAWPPRIPISTLDVALFSWMTVGPVILGFFFWHYAARRLGFVVASLGVNLVPVVAILLTAALGTRPTGLQLIGGGLVLAGVLQSQLRNRLVRT